MLYNFGIIAYRCAIGVASLFNEKAALCIHENPFIADSFECMH